MSIPAPWSTEIADYFKQLDGIAPTDMYDLATPRLPDGPHWGVIKGFNPDTPAAFDEAALTDALLSEAADRGATVARPQTDWASLESAPGVYNQALLDEILAEISAYDQAGLLTLTTLDSEGFTVPKHLVDSSTGGLIGGLTMASAEVQGAFQALLDWLVPQLRAAGFWGIAIGNEVEIPVQDQTVTESDAALFFEHAQAHIKALDPEMAVSVTLTATASDIAPELTERIADLSDVFSVNFYGNTKTGTPSEAEWRASIDRIKEMADGKPIFFQELGMSVRTDSTVTMSEGTYNMALAAQADFLSFMGQEIAFDPQLIGATIFQLYDWSPALLESYLEGLDGPFFEDFAVILGSIGLVDWTNGAIRPAWSDWLEALDTANAAQQFGAMAAFEGDETNEIRKLSSPEGDVVFARAGDDRISTAMANDAVDLGQGDDFTRTFAGDDIILAQDGNDTVEAGAGQDWAEGGAGRDWLQGNGGADFLDGGKGRDTLFGGGSEDQLHGNRGDDVLRGGKASDALHGGADEDTLLGGDADDSLYGGTGDDMLDGQGGNDLLRGGDGSDVFLFKTNGGHDRVENFELGVDLLLIDRKLVRNADEGADVVAQFGSKTENGFVFDFDTASITLEGRGKLDQLIDAVFLF